MTNNNITKFNFKGKTFLLDKATSSVYLINGKKNKFLSNKNSLSGWKNDFREISPQLQLCLSSMCNLRCKYCVFREREKKQQKKFMDLKTAFKAVDMFFQTLPKGQKFARIDFGISGEPFIAEKYHKALKEYIKNKLKNKKIKVWVGANMSNGLLYETDKMIQKLGDPMDISIDGTKEDNNKFRLYKNGNGTYDDLVKLIKKIKKYELDVGACAVITADTLDISKNFQHIVDLGITASIYMKPVNSLHSESYSLNKKNLGKFKNAYTKFIEFLLNQPDDLLVEYLKIINPEDYFFRFFYRILNKTILRYRCNCGKSGLYVDTDGQFYPCAHFIGAEGMAIGDIKKGISIKKRKMFLEQTVENRLPCKNCWAKYLCGGGCYYQGWLVNKDIKKPDLVKCELIKHFVKLQSYFISELIKKRKKVILDLGVPYFSGAINSVPPQKAGTFSPRQIGTLGEQYTRYKFNQNEIVDMAYNGELLKIKIPKNKLNKFEILIDENIKNKYNWDEICFYRDVFNHSTYVFDKKIKAIVVCKKENKNNMIEIPFKEIKGKKISSVKIIGNFAELNIPIKQKKIGFNIIFNGKVNNSMVSEFFGILKLDKNKQIGVNNLLIKNIIINNERELLPLFIEYPSSELFKKEKNNVQYDSSVC